MRKLLDPKNLIAAEAMDRLVEAQLIVAHSGTTMSKMPRGEFVAEFETAFYDQVTV